MGDVPRQQCTHARTHTHTHTDTRTRPHTHERAQSMYVDIKPVMRELFDDNPVVNSVDHVVMITPSTLNPMSVGMGRGDAFYDEHGQLLNAVVSGDCYCHWYMRRLAQIRSTA